MENTDKQMFYKSLKKMVMLTNGTYTLNDIESVGYWEALKGFGVERVVSLLEKIAISEEGHQSPGKLDGLLDGKCKTSASKDWSHLTGLLVAHGVEGAREKVDTESKGFKVLKAVGGFRALNSSGNDLAGVKSRFMAKYDGE